MNKLKHADHFKKRFVTMKKVIPAFAGKSVAGRTEGGTQFAIVCPNIEDCEAVWNLFMDIKLDRDNGTQDVVLCRESDVDMDFKMATNPMAARS